MFVASVSHLIKSVVRSASLPQRLYIFDTTLRDGEQMPGVAFTPGEKKIIAEQLAKLGVDVIEAGMPVVSEGERNAVKEIAKLGLNSEVCALARASREDVDVALECDVDRIHLFIATSDLHMKYKLKLSPEEVFQKAVESVEYAKSHGVKVEFSAEDATRSNVDFLKRIYSGVVDAGAEVINIPDTVGAATPSAYAYLVEEIKKVLTRGTVVSVHTHNDFGLATANALAAIEKGAQQVHVTVNGIGERAGNASLEEVVVSAVALYGIKVNVDTTRIFETSKLVERISGVRLPPNKPIIGDNAFKHESGIHAHAVLENPLTYEPIKPELIGRIRESIVEDAIVIGKHAGGHSLRAKLQEMGITCNEEQLREILSRIKELGDKGKKVTDVDLLAIAEDIVGQVSEKERILRLEELTVVTGKGITPTATVKIRVGNNEKIASAIGVGPVDAACNALQNAVKAFKEMSLIEYNLEAITGGTDALGFVTVKLRDKDGLIYTAKAADGDIVKASVQAIINAANKALLARGRLQKKGN
ncbi:MAG: 2-isopropylmalate synthase [Candidatus Freyarchaeota archaeon]|nr:2-isopropylmalate synthase [Candidatus Freyrarchaeum guaymaensis]